MDEDVLPDPLFMDIKGYGNMYMCKTRCIYLYVERCTRICQEKQG